MTIDFDEKYGSEKAKLAFFWTKIAVFSGFFLSGIVGYSPHPPRNEKSLCPRKLLQFKTSIFESLSSFDLSYIFLWLIDLHREFQRFCFTIIYRCRGTETINPFAFFRLQEKIGWHSTLSHVYQGQQICITVCTQLLIKRVLEMRRINQRRKAGGDFLVQHVNVGTGQVSRPFELTSQLAGDQRIYLSNDHHLAGLDPKRLPSNNATTVVLPLMGSTNCENI